MLRGSVGAKFSIAALNPSPGRILHKLANLETRLSRGLTVDGDGARVRAVISRCYKKRGPDTAEATHRGQSLFLAYASWYIVLLDY